MKPFWKRALVVTVVVLAAAAVTTVLWRIVKPSELVLSDDLTGRVFARFPAEEGDSFSITFRHSVNKSDVTEIYEIRDGAIWLTGCVYYNFGAGVAEDLDPSWTLTTGTEGEMILSGIDKEMTDLTYIVGTIYDHIMVIDGQTIVLNELCGKNAHVHFALG